MELSYIGIPIILEKLVGYFLEKEDKLKIQGIFRKSGFISELNILVEHL